MSIYGRLQIEVLPIIIIDGRTCLKYVFRFQISLSWHFLARKQNRLHIGLEFYKIESTILEADHKNKFFFS